MSEATVQLIRDMPAGKLAEIKRFGIFRCGVIVPDCRRDPVGELCDPKIQDDRGKPIRRLFCRKHMKEYCIRAGITVPVYGDANN